MEPTTVTVTTPNDRTRTYQFNSKADAQLWISTLATFDPATAATAQVSG